MDVLILNFALEFEECLVLTSSRERTSKIEKIGIKKIREKNQFFFFF